MLVVQIVLATLLVFSIIYHLLTTSCSQLWRSTQRPNDPPTQRPVTILKPLRGSDPEQYACFETYCRQEYSTYQIVFGALDSGDLGLEAARRLRDAYPQVDITIVEDGEEFGLNRKVCNLTAMLPHAKHDLLVLCDSDMRVGPDYLRRVAAPFADPQVGLVTCPYRGYAPASLASRLEAIGIGADFIPSVFVAYYLWGVRPAFGSTMALTKQTLADVGGFEPLANELADDYRLAEAVDRLGSKVILSDYMVDDALGAESFRAMWSRRLRWAKTSRLMRPGPYTGAFVTFTLPVALIFAAASGFSPLVCAAAAGSYTIRCSTAIWIASRFTRDPNVTRLLPLLPLSDLLSAALWICSFFGSTILWRGERFRVESDGRLVIPVTAASDPDPRHSTKTP